MLGFLRRRTAHARGGLGAAVTGVPSAPARPVVPPQVATTPGPRVELGFRDGTTTCLDPGSAEAQALDELARLLTRRL
jgi:hypothetical protein